MQRMTRTDHQMRTAASTTLLALMIFTTLLLAACGGGGENPVEPEPRHPVDCQEKPEHCK